MDCTIVSKQIFMLTLRHKFSTSALYRQKEESLAGFLSKRWSFWLALFSCVAFLIGNMVGQHGWQAFWKSVWGRESDQAIVFTGTVSPIALIPDPVRFQGSYHRYAFSDIPEDLLVPLPIYEERAHCGLRSEEDRRVYYVRNLGDYESGGDMCGSHSGVDISVPKGTPVFAMANGIVERVERRSRGFGKAIVLRHPRVPDPDNPKKTTMLFSNYAHLKNILVRKGDVIMKGDQIALSGQSGFATAPHLHFQIDRDEAPWHPFWPFTDKQASKRGWSFMQAVNRGLGRERGEQYTVSPLLYVQKYRGWSREAGPVFVHEKQGSMVVMETVEAQPHEQPSPRMTRVERLRARRQARLDRRLKRHRLAQRESPVVQAARVASTTKTPIAPKPKPIKNVPGLVASITIVHDGSFDGGWEQLVFFARDASGNFVRDVQFEGSFFLETIFGEARFSPSVLTSEQFDDRGRAFVRMLPEGWKTVIPASRGVFEAEGEPMVFAPRIESIRASARRGR